MSGDRRRRRRRRRRRPGQTMARSAGAEPRRAGVEHAGRAARPTAGAQPADTTADRDDDGVRRRGLMRRSARSVKLAVVVQRYGADINGGAELHARYIAERLARHAEVEVLTTCARDYVTWRERAAGRRRDRSTASRCAGFPVVAAARPARLRPPLAARSSSSRTRSPTSWRGSTARGRRARRSSGTSERVSATSSTSSCSSATATTTRGTARARCRTRRCSCRRPSAIRRSACRSSGRCSAACAR